MIRRTPHFLAALFPAAPFVAALSLAALVIALATASPAGAAEREIELRGTLLCRVDGDARRERPIESQMLIVAPVGLEVAAEVIGEAGLFRVKVPESYIDHQVILRIHRGMEEIHSLSIFLDAARVKQVGDRRVCQLGAFPLPGSCNDHTGTAAEAVMYRDEIRKSGAAEPVHAAYKPKLWQGGAVAALVGAGAAALGGGASPPADGLAGKLLPAEQPGGSDWPVYQQFCASPALGKTTTDRRHPEEAALWNPAVLALTGGSHIGGGYGETDEARASASWDLPVGESASWLVPRTVSAAMLAYLGSKETTVDFEDTGGSVTVDARSQDVLGTAALGWRLASDLAFSAGWRGIWQERGTFATETFNAGDEENPDFKTNVIDLTRENNESGLDLTAAWEARPDLRVGVTAYSLFGGEYEDSVGQTTPLSRGALGAAWTSGRWSLAAEGGVNAGELNAAAAIDFRAARWLGLSVAAGSRYEAVQGGVDITVGILTGRGRIRTDDFHDVAGWFGLSLAR